MAKNKVLLKLKPVEVINNIEIAENVFVLSFKRDFDFKVGQVLGIGLSATDDARLYSIASGEKDKDVQILYNIKPEGRLTPSMAALKSGDYIWISEPFGTYFGTEEPAYWIATGTGVAPFLSMARSGLHMHKKLIHGGRMATAFYFQDELLALLGDSYVRCCSAETGDNVFNGRVTQYLKTRENLPLQAKYYLCGSAEMVVECRDILLGKNIPFDNIISEIYF